jgi:EmrB/QacA subfamily drug resistance transporter
VDSAFSSPARRPHLALAVLCGVLFLTFLDNTVVSVTLADIQGRLHAGVVSLQWVVNGYALVFAALMLTGGTLGDLLGRKRVMLSGVALFCVGSVVAALAPNVGILVVGRVIMGTGAAASEPGTLSVIRHVFPETRERARAVGLWAAVSGLALALGPVLGGLLVGVADWRAVFWFNLGFGALAFVAAVVAVPESSDPAGRRLDPVGILLGAGALTAAAFGIIMGETAGYRTWWIVLLLVGSIGLGTGFARWETRASDPVLPVTFFRHPIFAGSNVVALFNYFATFAIFFFVALYLQLIDNSSAYRTAGAFVPMAVGLVISSLFTGRWVAVSGPRLPMVIGCLLGAAGTVLTRHLIGPGVGLVDLGLTMGLAGLGFGMAIVPVTSSVLTVAPPERSGMAASATNTSREMGAVLGVAVLGALVNGSLTSKLTATMQALHIPSQFQGLVITYVTTGAAPSSIGGVSISNPAVKALENKILGAAAGAFLAGLRDALLLAAVVLVLGAVVSAATIGAGRPSAIGSQR